ncbi:MULTISPECIES: hypothetical protein [unclassified Bradyrhizobium]|uniref:hypothetical protein n=1 Tax=unclassified Bradyrhizobium TaxID=2631580 RepID=UPI001FF7BA72|nr:MULTISPECIES: hypothetical protein [unclassified Bradyrhizobium]MCK1419464.1 hypothetical protein [Bradyrhizobium sp. CW12]MCK1644665.1 hypothetical protein [Bradyrhizobium sp. 154]
MKAFTFSSRTQNFGGTRFYIDEIHLEDGVLFSRGIKRPGGRAQNESARNEEKQ